MTYGDIIRTLPDEDLAKFIINATNTAVKTSLQGTGYYFDEDDFDNSNRGKAILDFLKEEVKGT